MSYQNFRSPSSAKSARSPRTTGPIPRGKENKEFKYNKGDRVLIREADDSHWNVGKVYPDEGGKRSTFMVRQEDENGRVCRSGRFCSPENLRDIPLEYLTGMQTYPALSETFPHRNYDRLVRVCLGCRWGRQAVWKCSVIRGLGASNVSCRAFPAQYHI
ncbi:hypothetical protein BJ912DRAFT_1046180, partial [Pholiota molesta]